MQQNDGSSSDWLIAESRHYYIKGEYESVDLYSKMDNTHIICVGDFYGDPSDAIIDYNERFVVSVGCGYIIYYLKEPFEPYLYNRDTSQWMEAGRGPDNIEWIKSVRQIDDSTIELIGEDDVCRTIIVPNL